MQWQWSGETIINIFYVSADTVQCYLLFPWPFSNHDKALNYGCHNTGDGSSTRARGEQDTQAVLEAEEVTITPQES